MSGDEAISWGTQGDLLVKQGLYEAALGTSEQWLVMEPNSLQAAVGEFKVFLRLKRYGKALNALQQAWKATKATARQNQQVGARGRGKGKR